MSVVGECTGENPDIVDVKMARKCAKRRKIFANTRGRLGGLKNNTSNFVLHAKTQFSHFMHQVISSEESLQSGKKMVLSFQQLNRTPRCNTAMKYTTQQAHMLAMVHQYHRIVGKAF